MAGQIEVTSPASVVTHNTQLASHVSRKGLYLLVRVGSLHVDIVKQLCHHHAEHAGIELPHQRRHIACHCYRRTTPEPGPCGSEYIIAETVSRSLANTGCHVMAPLALRLSRRYGKASHLSTAPCRHATARGSQTHSIPGDRSLSCTAVRPRYPLCNGEPCSPGTPLDQLRCCI